MVKYIDSASRVRLATSLASSRKDQEYGAGTVGVPGGASKTPAGPLQIGEIAPIRLYPENPLNPR